MCNYLQESATLNLFPYICSMFNYTTDSYGQVEFSPDARNCSYEIGESTKIIYTITPTKTGQDDATSKWQTSDKHK